MKQDKQSLITTILCTTLKILLIIVIILLGINIIAALVPKVPVVGELELPANKLEEYKNNLTYFSNIPGPKEK